MRKYIKMFVAFFFDAGPYRTIDGLHYSVNFVVGTIVVGLIAMFFNGLPVSDGLEAMLSGVATIVFGGLFLFSILAMPILEYFSIRPKGFPKSGTVVLFNNVVCFHMSKMLQLVKKNAATKIVNDKAIRFIKAVNVYLAKGGDPDLIHDALCGQKRALELYDAGIALNMDPSSSTICLQIGTSVTVEEERVSIEYAYEVFVEDFVFTEWKNLLTSTISYKSSETKTFLTHLQICVSFLVDMDTVKKSWRSLMVKLSEFQRSMGEKEPVVFLDCMAFPTTVSLQFVTQKATAPRRLGRTGFRPAYLDEDEGG